MINAQCLYFVHLDFILGLACFLCSKVTLVKFAVCFVEITQRHVVWYLGWLPWSFVMIKNDKPVSFSEILLTAMLEFVFTFSFFKSMFRKCSEIRIEMDDGVTRKWRCAVWDAMDRNFRLVSVPVKIDLIRIEGCKTSRGRPRKHFLKW